MKNRFLLILSVSLLIACQQLQPAVETHDDKVMMEFFICVSGNDDPSVKSILSSDTENKVTDLTIVSYDENGGLMDVQYHTDVNKVSLYVSNNGVSSIYALANMGDITLEIPRSEKDMSNLCYVLDSFSEVEKRGIPMCAKVLTSVSEPVNVLWLERLFAKVKLRISHKSLENASSIDRYAYNLCNLSAYVRQANRRFFPFAPGGSRAFVPEDVMNISDFDPNLHDREGGGRVYSDDEMGPGFVQDTTIVLYVPENMQGKLLSVDGSDRDKTGPNIENINGKDYSRLCTYIEVTVNKVADESGLSGHLAYRFYLGENQYTDFSIERNLIYNLTLDITSESFSIDNWKVSRKDNWSDQRVLRFDKDEYVISPGSLLNVFVHYHRTQAEKDSENRPADWTYDFENRTISMDEAGLSYSLNSSLAFNQDDIRDFCFTFIASSRAQAGEEFPLIIRTNDGEVADYAVIRIDGEDNELLEWSFKPSYIAQAGDVTLLNIPEGGVVNARSSDPSVMSVERIDDDSFHVVALNAGYPFLIFENADGAVLHKLSMSFGTPKLKLFVDRPPVLSPDGSPVKLEYQYLDYRGDVLEWEHFDESVFSATLALDFSEDEFIDVGMDGFDAYVFVSRLRKNDEIIKTESYHYQRVKAVNCKSVNYVDFHAYVTEPFKGLTSMDYGRLDDYTLFSLPDVDSDVSGRFAYRIEENRKRKFYAPSVNAPLSNVMVELVPRWQEGFSFENQVYSLSYSADCSFSDGMAFKIEKNEITETTRHGAGPHDIMIHVLNRISGEKMSFNCGSIDIYVHTAIGARAEFSWQYANHITSGSSASPLSFAQVYNLIAGDNVLSDASGMKVYYMDVSAEFITEVTGVQVLERFLFGSRTGENIMDAQYSVCPSVQDGSVNTGLGLMYSVNGTDPIRQNLALESYGKRRGVGTMLYRALSLKKVSSEYGENVMLSWFLGAGINGNASYSYSPCYHVTDVMTGRKVGRYSAWYFAPSQYPDYVDDDGKGFHVIHFLDKLCPETAGWINLL